VQILSYHPLSVGRVIYLVIFGLIFKFSAKNSLTETQAEEFKKYETNIFYIIHYLKSICSDKYFSDKIRLNRIIAELQTIEEALSLTKKSKTSHLSSNVIIQCVERVEELLNEPLVNFFPDIHLWMLCNNTPVGICNIKSADVLWSSEKYQKGYLCNKYIYADVIVSFLRFKFRFNSFV